MSRNGIGIPFFALVVATVCFAVARFITPHAALASGGAPEPLSAMQVGFIAFGVTLVVYGAAGVGSVWLHGVELRPGTHRPHAPMPVVLLALIATLALAGVAGTFVFLVRQSAAGIVVDTGTVGGVGGGAFFLIALLIVLYARYFLPAVVEVESQQDRGHE
jgi:hypothetical protein